MLNHRATAVATLLLASVFSLFTSTAEARRTDYRAQGRQLWRPFHQTWTYESWNGAAEVRHVRRKKAKARRKIRHHRDVHYIARKAKRKPVRHVFIPLPRSGPARDEAGLVAILPPVAPILPQSQDPPPVAMIMPWPKVLPQSLAIEPPKEDGPPLPKANPRRVFPATAVQRGQFRDRRPSHLHAGIDLVGRLGSAIVAAFTGTVLPKPGGDRGYGPHVLVIKGDDGIVYRYAHLASTKVSAGQKVKTGDGIGTMGKLGSHGTPHLHFEAIPVNEYRRNPYGAGGRLDPNKLFGGHRGTTMVAGHMMPPVVTMLASTDEKPKAKAKKKTSHRKYAKRHSKKHRTRYAAK